MGGTLSPRAFAPLCTYIRCGGAERLKNIITIIILLTMTGLRRRTISEISLGSNQNFLCHTHTLSLFCSPQLSPREDPAATRFYSIQEEGDEWEEELSPTTISSISAHLCSSSPQVDRSAGWSLVGWRISLSIAR